MAVSSSSYFSNSIIGTPGLGADIDIYEVNTSPKYAVGFGFERADGNKYRYSHFGADTNRGVLVATDKSESSLVDTDNVGALAANITKRAGETLNPNVIGSRYLQFVITATANQFDGGYITITDDTGEGYTYRIRGHTVTSDNNPVTGNIYMDLYDQVVVAIDSNSDISINGCGYANLEIATASVGADNGVVGITVAGVSSSNYAWIQTVGITGVLQDATLPAHGELVALSSNTAGAISDIPATSSGGVYTFVPIVGICLDPGDSTGHSVIDLTLE